MKRRRGKQAELPLRLILACVFLVGLGALLYPFVSKAAAAKAQSRAVQSYERFLVQVDTEAMEKARAAADVYNEALRTGGGTDYADLLALGEVIAVLSIEKLGLTLPVYDGTGEDVLQHGVGRLENTSLPVGGAGTHAVLTGHSGLPDAGMFDRLHEMERGDEFTICALGKTLTYRVDQIAVVLPEETEKLAIEADRDVVTLVTCTPYAVNTHRLLVRGTRQTDAQ